MGRIGRAVTELYRKHFQQKLFNKILFMYSMIVAISLLVLSFFIYQYFLQDVVNKTNARQREMVQAASNYIDQRIDDSRALLENLYSNGTVASDVAVLLGGDYNRYLDYTFERYFQKNGSGPLNPSLKTLLGYIASGTDIDSMLFASRDGSYYLVADDSLQIVPSIAGRDAGKPGGDPLLAGSNGLVPTPMWPAAQGKRLYSFAAQLKDPATLAPIGTMMINFKAGGLLRAIPQLRSGSEGNGDVLVLTQDGDVLFDSSNRYYGQTYPVERLLGSDATKAKPDPKATALVSTSNKAGVVIAAITPDDAAGASMRVFARWLFALTGLCIAGALLLTYVAIMRLSKRTRVIVRAMENFDVGQLSVRIPLGKGDELYQIAYNFNKMGERLNHYIEKVYVSEIKQKNAEIVAMQMQINPHFLYNTLEAIRMNAVAQGVPEVGKMIYLLATLFRTSMKSGMIVRIADEIERCRVYLELFQIRYPDMLTVDFDMSEEIGRHDILKLSIQPLVENYVLHGFAPNRSDNRLAIEGAMQGETIRIRIRDNGNGIAPGELRKIQRSFAIKGDIDGASGSIGLGNVNMRIQMHYGSEYGLTIDSKEQAGTEVVLTIPAGSKE